MFGTKLLSVFGVSAMCRPVPTATTVVASDGSGEVSSATLGIGRRPTRVIVARIKEIFTFVAPIGVSRNIGRDPREQRLCHPAIKQGGKDSVKKEGSHRNADARENRRETCTFSAHVLIPRYALVHRGNSCPKT